MIDKIKIAAEKVGITAVVSNATEKLEVQLNRLTKHEDLPLMLVSWDLNMKITFNEHGLLNNPTADVVTLLLDKPEDTTKDEHENTAERMYFLYLDFIQALRNELVEVQVNYGSEPITNAGCDLAPMYGLGKHSGVVGRFTMITGITNCHE